MKRFLLLLLLFGCGSGCAMMDEVMFGPEPSYPTQTVMPYSCNQATKVVTATQTAEPELSRR